MPRELCFGFGLAWLSLGLGSLGLGCTLWPQLSWSRHGGRDWDGAIDREGKWLYPCELQAFSRKNSRQRKSKNVVVVTVVAVAVTCMYSKKAISTVSGYSALLCPDNFCSLRWQRQNRTKDERPLRSLWWLKWRCCSAALATASPTTTQHPAPSTRTFTDSLCLSIVLETRLEETLPAGYFQFPPCTCFIIAFNGPQKKARESRKRKRNDKWRNNKKSRQQVERRESTPRNKGGK